MKLWRVTLLVERASGGFATAGGTRLAAAISYYALLSLVPLFLMLVAAANLVVGSEDARADLVDQIVDGLPLTADGAEQARDILMAAGGGTSAVGLASVVGLLWAASGMMGAIRTGLGAVSGAEHRRGFVLAKLVDLGMVLFAGGLLLAAAVLTVAMRVADERLLAPLGIPGAETLAGLVVPIALTFVTLAVLLRFVPAERIAWNGVWRGALGGSVALWAAATGFAFYVDNFSRYNVIYGSLGAVVVFLIFVYLAALILLLTAAAAAAWPDLASRRSPPPANPYGPPARQRVRNLLRGLVRKG